MSYLNDATIVDLAEQDYRLYGGSYGGCGSHVDVAGLYRPPVSNVTYADDKLKINANVAPNQMACLGVGFAVGALVGAYLFKKYLSKD